MVKETVWTQTELGYKGQISDKMTLAVDVYDINVEGYVTNLQSMSGLVAVNADVTSLIGSMVANTATIDAVNGQPKFNWIYWMERLEQMLMRLLAVMMKQLSYFNKELLVPQWVLFLLRIHHMVVTLIVGYKQMSEDLNLKGMEATLNYFPNTDWNFYMNMSFLNDNVLEADA